ncbi:MAG: phosphohydrolase, partial [Bacteroidota bacterium]|nr:phosphohydrolase [Bacteroidota bacterium]
MTNSHYHRIDYLHIIEKHLDPRSPAFRYYLVHVTLVTAKALQIAKRLNLSAAQMRFIEEAAMLHDIGIVKVSYPEIGCHGTLPYIAHIT